MKSIIGMLLFVFWILLVCLLGAEPTDEPTFQIEGQWAGYVYIIMLFGLPFVWGNLLKDK
jgi:hypothetical protein